MAHGHHALRCGLEPVPGQHILLHAHGKLRQLVCLGNAWPARIGRVLALDLRESCLELRRGVARLEFNAHCEGLLIRHPRDDTPECPAPQLQALELRQEGQLPCRMQSPHAMQEDLIILRQAICCLQGDKGATRTRTTNQLDGSGEAQVLHQDLLEVVDPELHVDCQPSLLRRLEQLHGHEPASLGRFLVISELLEALFVGRCTGFQDVSQGLVCSQATITIFPMGRPYYLAECREDLADVRCQAVLQFSRAAGALRRRSLRQALDLRSELRLRVQHHIHKHLEGHLGVSGEGSNVHAEEEEA
mmetsp:Transcript_36100/g.93066  ORF Transcript_36100/g.93066 Transcript_36100/m.93066 type:complete len:303 (+) Transcript_36100:1807-2715(+)